MEVKRDMFNKDEQNKLFQAKKEHWKLFIDHNIIHDEVDPVVAQSWIRSKAEGIDPYEPKPKCLGEEEMKERYNANKMLIECARPLMDKLFELGGNAVNVMSLHDKDGYMLEISNRSKSSYSWKEDIFKPGIRWSEKDVGTNALGLALVVDKPIQIIGSEHYSFMQKDICCSATPIHGSKGELMGVLNVSGPLGKYTPHMLVLVVFGGYAIENQIQARQSHEFLETVFSVISEGMVMIDRYYNIIRCSMAAAQIFDAKPSDFVGNYIQDVIRIPRLETRIKQSQTAFQCRECSSFFNDKAVRCDVTVSPIYKENNFLGAALVIRGSKNVTKQATALTGNRACYSFDDIITGDNVMLNIIQEMKDSANTDCSILISGESGTGKELFAHAIHTFSDRRDEPFVAVNCASLPRSLVESELFGYERGAFSGALSEGNPGKFELSNGGTIFLDEIGEMPLEIQPKLLRVLDTHRIRRIGGKTEKELDIRVIAATNRNLYEAVKNKNFREDLYYRLNVLNFRIPPLRDRIDDVDYLVSFMIDRLNRQTEGENKTISPELIGVLKKYAWPGNVRELQNALVRAFYCCPDIVIEPKHLMLHNSETIAVTYRNPFMPGRITVEEFERQNVIECLRSCNGSVVDAAAKLKLSKATLYRRLKKYNINLKTDLKLEKQA